MRQTTKHDMGHVLVHLPLYGGIETSVVAGDATCGSAECRMACPTGGAVTSYDSIAEVCYTRSGTEVCGCR